MLLLSVLLDSHLKGENLAFVEMEKGNAYITLRGTYHAGGENTTTDETSPMHGLFFTRGAMRAEEISILFTPSKKSCPGLLKRSERWAFTCSVLILDLLTFSLL